MTILYFIFTYISLQQEPWRIMSYIAHLMLLTDIDIDVNGIPRNLSFMHYT